MPKILTFSIVAFTASACSLASLTPITRRPGPFDSGKPGLAYRNSAVYRDGEPIIRVKQTDIDKYTTHYDVHSVDGTALASVTFSSSYGDTIECRAEFPSLGVHYETRYPIISFAELLASYFKTGVLVDAAVEKTGLHAYAGERGIALVDTGAQLERIRVAGELAMCERCVEDYRACQVESSQRRRNPRPGLTVKKSCTSQFHACSLGGIMQYSRKDEWPCGAPPQ